MGDLFFPKPFNDEQIDIVHRLEQSDGVVVQGPPGTGKTHTISNIICHYMATGRRVLVVSHGEPALAVLRDQLPEEVRNLAISITTSEREGFKQLETAVRLLQSTVQSLRPSEQARLIEDIEQSIVWMRQRLAAIDVEIEKVAQTQLSPVPGMEAKPADLAKSVVQSRKHFAWFTDRPRKFIPDLHFTETDITALHKARIALGNRIEHLDAVLPAIHDLPDGAKIANLHENLIRAEDFANIVTQDRSLSIRITSLELLQHADRAVEALETLVGVWNLIEGRQWLRAVAARSFSKDEEHPVLIALQPFITDASNIIEEHARYLQRPVNIPDAFVCSPETVAIVASLANGEKVFGVFAFKQKAHRDAIEAIQVLGRKPANISDWAHVRDHLLWRERMIEMSRRWEPIAAEIGAPQVNLTEIGALQRDVKSTIKLSELVRLLRAIVLGAPTAIRQLEVSFPYIAYGVDHVPSLWQNAQRLASAREIVRSAVAATRLSAAKVEIDRIADRFSDRGGKIGTIARHFLTNGVGRRGIDKAKVEHAWDTLRASIDDLAQLRAEFETVRQLGKRIEAAGAPQWAKRILHEVAEEADDPVTPPDWKQAWDWAAAELYLQRIDQRDHLGLLSEERVRLDQSIAKKFESLVRERTFAALERSMTGSVRSALMMFATALRRIGKGTGKGAVRHRKDAQSAMSQCYGLSPAGSCRPGA